MCYPGIPRQIPLLSSDLSSIRCPGSLSMMAVILDHRPDWLLPYTRSVYMFYYTKPPRYACFPSHLSTKLPVELCTFVCIGPGHVRFCFPGQSRCLHTSVRLEPSALLANVMPYCWQVRRLFPIRSFSFTRSAASNLIAGIGLFGQCSLQFQL